MLGIVRSVFLTFLICKYVFALRNTYPSCRSRDSCVRLTDCQPYMGLIKSLKRPLTSAAVVFLRRQECGFDGTIPMVCCFPDKTTEQLKKNNLSFEKDYDKNPEFIVNNSNEYRPTEKPIDATFTPTTTLRTAKIEKSSKHFRENLYDFTTPPIIIQSTTKSKLEMRDKMEALNQAFAYSDMDYFFRRMLDEKQGTSYK